MQKTNASGYSVALFLSAQGAILAERILKKKGIPYKLIPVPRHLSSDCGVCIRFATEDEQKVKEALLGKVEIQGISPL